MGEWVRGSAKRQIKMQAIVRMCRAVSARECHSMSRLADKNYWEGVYKKQSPSKGSFEWFVPPSAIIDHVKHWARQVAGERDIGQMSILEIGCGTSALALQLRREGFFSVEAVDFAPSAVTHMQTVARDEFADARPPQFRVMDVTDMKYYADNTFDIVLDKGTMDALVHGDKSSSLIGSPNWVMPTDDLPKVVKMASEIWRVQHPHGVYLQITEEPPDLRVDFLADIFGYAAKHKHTSAPVITHQHLDVGGNEGEGPGYYLYAVRREPQ